MPVARADNQGWKQKDHASGYPCFDDKHNLDLLRCELCWHGPTCKRYRKGICGYAHAFKDLQPPNETTTLYNNVWRNGVSRWYGQDVTPFGIRMFSWYYGMTAKADIPVWAHGLKWYISDEADAQLDPWPTNFDLLTDFANVTRARRGCQKPFVWAKDLEQRLFWRMMQRTCDGIDQTTKVSIAEGVRDQRVVYSSNKHPPEERRRMSLDGIDQAATVGLSEGMRGPAYSLFSGEASARKEAADLL